MVQQIELPKTKNRNKLPIKVKKQIGKGGFGVVYEIEYKRKPAALKIVDKSRMKQNLNLLKGEVATIQKIQKIDPKCDKKLLCYKDISEDKQNVYFVSELMKGNLLELILSKEFQSQSICKKINIFWNILNQVLGGLETLHKAGILHRDIKPENILIGRTASKSPYKKYGAKIADFGLGCLKNECKGRSGSMPYMQPRILFQENFNDWRTGDDLYALGITLFVILTGKLFIDKDMLQKLIQKNVSFKYAANEYIKLYLEQMKVLEILKINSRKCPTAARKKLDKIIKLTKYLTIPVTKNNVTVTMARKILK